MKIAARLALMLLPLGATLAATPASAVVLSTTSTFYFSGVCTDCTGIGRGELVLSNYTLGDAITNSNFVSFHYDGSDLIGAFTITDAAYGLGGTINAPLPSAESFYVYGLRNYFSSNTSGNWTLGRFDEVALDYGTSGAYSDVAPTTAVPEPISLSVLVVGLAGTALVRRRSVNR